MTRRIVDIFSTLILTILLANCSENSSLRPISDINQNSPTNDSPFVLIESSIFEKDYFNYNYDAILNARNIVTESDSTWYYLAVLGKARNTYPSRLTNKITKEKINSYLITRGFDSSIDLDDRKLNKELLFLWFKFYSEGYGERTLFWRDSSSCLYTLYSQNNNNPYYEALQWYVRSKERTLTAKLISKYKNLKETDYIFFKQVLSDIYLNRKNDSCINLKTELILADICPVENFNQIINYLYYLGKEKKIDSIVHIVNKNKYYRSNTLGYYLITKNEIDSAQSVYYKVVKDSIDLESYYTAALGLLEVAAIKKNKSDLAYYLEKVDSVKTCYTVPFRINCGPMVNAYKKYWLISLLVQRDFVKYNQVIESMLLNHDNFIGPYGYYQSEQVFRKSVTIQYDIDNW